MVDHAERDALIRKRHADGVQQKIIAREFKVTPRTVRRVVAYGQLPRHQQAHATATASLAAEVAAGRAEIEQGLAQIAASRGQKI